METLIANGYAVIHEDIFTLTDKVLEVDTKVLTVKESTPEGRRSLQLVNPKSKSVIPAAGESSVLIKFIIDCEVPQKIKTADGQTYWANKYSKEAEVELRKILLDGYNLDILTTATKLYYKSGGFCEAITNYICRGTWLTHYNEMKKQLDAGTVQKHIQSNLNDQVSGGALYNDR
ncbi:unnamed protein product [Sphagnum balticum]